MEASPLSPPVPRAVDAAAAAMTNIPRTTSPPPPPVPLSAAAPPLPHSTLHHRPGSTRDTNAVTTRSSTTSAVAPPPQPPPLPRLYAPLLSLLNPIEDSSVGDLTTLHSATDRGEPTDGARDASFVDDAEQQQQRQGGGEESETVPLLPPTVPPSPQTHIRPISRMSQHMHPGSHTSSTTATTTTTTYNSAHHSTGEETWLSSLVRRAWTAWKELRHDMAVRGAREVLPVNEPRRFDALDREKMARYESVDTYEAESVLYKDHLETRSHEPRWFMWVFVFVLGIGTSALSLGVVACLHVLNAIRYELLGFGLRHFTFADVHRYANATAQDTSLDAWAMLRGHNVGLYGIEQPLSYGHGYLLWAAFALAVSTLASAVCFCVPECVGSGIPEVKAYLNGVSYPMMRSTRVLIAKILAVVLTVSSGVCTGHYGHLMLAGAMLGAQLLQRRHGLRCYHVHFVDCFRNPRDRRVILVIGAAAGIAAAFCVSVGGLLVVLELLSAVFSVRFALYVFAACLLSQLFTQMYFSYWVNFDARYRPNGGLQHGELLSEAVVLFQTVLPFGQHPSMNLMDFVPAFLIGLCSGAAAVVFVRVSWAALYCRRQLEVVLGTKAIRYVLPILFTLLYVSVHYWIAVAFTYEPYYLSKEDANASRLVNASTPAVCRRVPYAVRSGRNATTISFYGMNGFLCPAAAEKHDGTSFVRGDAGLTDAALPAPQSNTAAAVTASEPLRQEQSVRVVDAYASLAFAYADSALQTLLSERTASLLPWRALLLFSVLYFFSSAVYSGLALCGDALLPSLVIGAALGRCVGVAVHGIAVMASGSAAAWADPGVFALFGAGSFVSATCGLSFGIGAILIESTADFRHLLPLMFSIVVARRIFIRRCRDVFTMYLEARAVPLLSSEPYMDRFSLLDAGHVMRGPAVTLPVVCSLECLAHVLRTTTHHAFPVVSVKNGTCKGIVSRAQVELLVWHLILTQGRATHCTYEVLQRVEDHVFHNHWEGQDPTEHLPPERLRSTQISLYPHVDTSAFAVLNTTALPRTYEMFTTLGLRHLVVVNRANHVAGMITRKDLTGDHLSTILEAKEEAYPSTREIASSSSTATLTALLSEGQQQQRRRPRLWPSGGNGAARGSGYAPWDARTSALTYLHEPLLPSSARVAEIARSSSTRHLPQQQ